MSAAVPRHRTMAHRCNSPPDNVCTPLSMIGSMLSMLKLKLMLKLKDKVGVKFLYSGSMYV